MSKKDVVKLYDRFGPKMCLAPFLNSFYSTCGVVGAEQTVSNHVRPCSMIRPGAFWDIKENKILDSRNNWMWKELRKTFLDGRLHDLCTTCSNAESAGASSPRQLNNEYLFEHLPIDIIAEVERIINNDFVAEAVVALDYMPSNFCNYACVMCFAGASSQRYTFEIKNGNQLKYQINPVDTDFFDLIQDVKILGFTGGETIMQPEVHRLLDYIIEQGLAQDMIITMLTNGSEFPDNLLDKFAKFKRVLYTVSIDGVGPVIEYQRRGAVWATVEQNALKINRSPVVHEIINHVTSAINILGAMDFVDWCYHNKIENVAVSAVYQEHLGAAVLPPELRTMALERLQTGRARYDRLARTGTDIVARKCIRTIDLLLNTVNNTPHKPSALEAFVKHIQRENLVSTRTLDQAVPEWAPWFAN